MISVHLGHWQTWWENHKLHRTTRIFSCFFHWSINLIWLCNYDHVTKVTFMNCSVVLKKNINKKRIYGSQHSQRLTPSSSSSFRSFSHSASARCLSWAQLSGQPRDFESMQAKLAHAAPGITGIRHPAIFFLQLIYWTHEVGNSSMLLAQRTPTTHHGHFERCWQLHTVKPDTKLFEKIFSRHI